MIDHKNIRLGRCSVAEIRRIGHERGMADLLDDGMTKVLDGVTSLSEVIQVLGQTGAKVPSSS